MVDEHCVRAVHAEANAVCQCAMYGINAGCSTLYVTASPCVQCLKLAASAGVVEIVYGEPYRAEDGLVATLAKECHVLLRQFGVGGEDSPRGPIT